MQRPYPQIDIIITSRRYRLCDPDGISGKALLDGIVRAGILPDDSAEYINEVRHKQIKIKKHEKETTLVEFVRAEQ